MWDRVKYKKVLEIGETVRVFHTGHEAKVSNIIDTHPDEYPLHCKCYHIEPRDPKDPGGNWYFSHCLETLTSKEELKSREI